MRAVFLPHYAAAARPSEVPGTGRNVWGGESMSKKSNFVKTGFVTARDHKILKNYQ